MEEFFSTDDWLDEFLKSSNDAQWNEDVHESLI